MIEPLKVVRFERAVALGLVGALLVLTAIRYSAPSPLPADAPSDVFSAERARAILQRLVGSRTPHPTGSVDADRVRDGVLSELRALGYSPELSSEWVCSAIASCARVQNIVAVKEGTERDGKVVLVSSHYDSVAAGPGASDDGVGVVATLEIARALSKEPPARNPVVLFINDGEEGGLKGAEAFVASHPLFARVGAVVNMEARGTSGPSLMFETSDRNGKILSLFAEHVTRPATNSIYYTVYKLLPNDTDLTVYKRARLRGLNFAFVGDEVRYHTPLDDYEHADPGSIQHQGQNALAMVRAFAGTDLDALEAPDAVFFDLFTLATVVLSVTAVRILSVLALAVVVVAIVLGRRRRVLTGGMVGWGIVGVLGTLLGTALIAALTHASLQTGGAFEYFFLAHPAPSRIAFAAGALGVGALVAGFIDWRAGRTGLWAATALVFALVGVVAAVLAPGLAYPFALPALVAGIAGLVAFRTSPSASLALWMPPLVVAATLWLPLAWLLYQGIGVFGLGVSAVVLQLVLLFAAPVWIPRGESRRFIVAFAGVWVIASVTALVVPDFTREHPQKINVEYQLILAADAPPRAQWAVTPMTGKLPEPLRSAAAFSGRSEQPLPWNILLPAHLAPAPVLELVPPMFVTSQVTTVGGNLRVKGRLSSPRGAHDAGVVVPEARLIGMAMNGKAAPSQRSKNLVRKLLAGDGWINLDCHTTGVEGVEVEFELRGTEPATLYLWDTTYAVPPQGEALLRARPETATRYQAGDRTLVAREVRLTP